MPQGGPGAAISSTACGRRSGARIPPPLRSAPPGGTGTGPPAPRARGLSGPREQDLGHRLRTLRRNTSIQNVPLRFAAADIEIEGTLVREGDALLVSYGSAGRDELLHAEGADRFDITRQDKTHVSFSHGAHYCLGANLARMELAVALPALWERFPGLELLETDPEQVPSIVSNGVTSLRVRLG
ncbi:cytochrome P450 [Nocardiopsis composta]|uniref:cytochrome P450 n=1 Tax=Nocardiopsis composta TaxID=157465 RepID=UPI0028AEEEC6|nr:cytochrome P450 [Nocardiopsis composta]